MENDEIKLTKKQLREMERLSGCEAALIAVERTHIVAMVDAQSNLEESKKNWWIDVAGDRAGEGWIYDQKAKVVRRS